ncbi:hypothetical protein AZI11_00205 [Levilactobacillus brevis]|uniref:hypothetical protein n=1 Tax=Levilactobacillus brevis TaxID=1580 RepID=UPI000A208254|nr:hypothetical protein [Levilactobacillus brevis]ARN91438.1 hypothetical protein AZI11_00205 [Levilactobacillus brevis]ARN94181.1 hypothetical protein AZI12_00205 [Levilactobacillus brevis]
MKSIDVSVLQPVYRELCDLLGEDGLLKVFEYYRGDQMTFPSHLYRGELVSKKLGQSEVSSSDYRVLARYYGYSERWVRKQVQRY